MGSRGSSNIQSVESQIDQFLKELETRSYGTSKKLVPDKQAQEYREAKRSIAKTQENFEGTVILASGFRTNEQYLHTAGKLNSYQRMVRSEVNAVKMDLSLGVITKEQAEKELRVLKSLDATIQDRRQRL